MRETEREAQRSGEIDRQAEIIDNHMFQETSQ